MQLIDILKQIDLGDSVAENEQDQIVNYFVKTEAWEMVSKGQVDIIYGGKGTGKSALYLLLMQQREKMKEVGIHLIAGEEVAEAPVFRTLNDDERKLTENEFRNLWKAYILTLVGNYAKNNLSQISGLSKIISLLEDEGFIPVTGLKRVFKVAYDKITRSQYTLEMPEGMKYTIVLGETTLEEDQAGKISAKEMLSQIDQILAASNIEIWILFDRLDVAFTDPEVESPALRALFRVYRDFASFKSIKLKIFLRDDIWDRITRETGFREQSHITRTYTIRWNKDSLRHLILNRFYNNQVIEEYAGLPKDRVLGHENAQKFVFDLIFQKQIEPGPKQLETLEWILSRIQDGKQNPAPREVIHLIKAAREQQVRIEEVGGTGSQPAGILLSENALKQALDDVSRQKVNTIWSEYPELRKYVEAFEGVKTGHTHETLKKLFESQGLPIDDLSKFIKQLVDIGFFREKRGVDLMKYWIPFIFRPYLSMIHGAAYEKNGNGK